MAGVWFAPVRRSGQEHEHDKLQIALFAEKKGEETAITNLVLLCSTTGSVWKLAPKSRVKKMREGKKPTATDMSLEALGLSTGRCGNLCLQCEIENGTSPSPSALQEVHFRVKSVSDGNALREVDAKLTKVLDEKDRRALTSNVFAEVASAFTHYALESEALGREVGRLQVQCESLHQALFKATDATKTISNTLVEKFRLVLDAKKEQLRDLRARLDETGVADTDESDNEQQSRSLDDDVSQKPQPEDAPSAVGGATRAQDSGHGSQPAPAPGTQETHASQLDLILHEDEPQAERLSRTLSGAKRRKRGQVAAQPRQRSGPSAAPDAAAFTTRAPSLASDISNDGLANDSQDTPLLGAGTIAAPHEESDDESKARRKRPRPKDKQFKAPLHTSLDTLSPADVGTQGTGDQDLSAASCLLPASQEAGALRREKSEVKRKKRRGLFADSDSDEEDVLDTVS